VKTVLIVDDELSVLEMLAGILEDEGYQVIMAADGLDALKRLANARPDLILSDVMMPGMDGRDLCRALHKNPDLAGIPLVFLTASHRATLGPDCHPTAFVAKPFDIGQVLATVERLTGSQR
jgi:CheY-like chemotaxis protein